MGCDMGYDKKQKQYSILLWYGLWYEIGPNTFFFKKNRAWIGLVLCDSSTQSLNGCDLSTTSNAVRVFDGVRAAVVQVSSTSFDAMGAAAVWASNVVIMRTW